MRANADKKINRQILKPESTHVYAMHRITERYIIYLPSSKYMPDKLKIGSFEEANAKRARNQMVWEQHTKHFKESFVGTSK